MKNRICSPSPIEEPSDPGCSKWNTQGNVCLECSQRFVFNGQKCTPVSDDCKTWGSSGRCTDCYDGYVLLSDGTCTIDNRFNEPTDKGCGLWDWKNKKCLKCSENWVFNNQGICIPVSDQCQTFNLAGDCVTCYDGYNLVNGRCELAPIEGPSDKGCGLWDWKNKKCLKCSENWVFNNQGICIPVSDHCKTYNLAGHCVSCYKGYNLVGTRC